MLWRGVVILEGKALLSFFINTLYTCDFSCLHVKWRQQLEEVLVHIYLSFG
jgi:hypothetical protein